MSNQRLISYYEHQFQIKTGKNTILLDFWSVLDYITYHYNGVSLSYLKTTTVTEVLRLWSNCFKFQNLANSINYE